MGDWFNNHYGILFKSPVTIGILCVVILGTPIMYAASKGLDSFHAANRQVAERNNANNCLGQYRTIECYQFKIDQLKLEKEYQESLNAKQPGRK